LNVHIEGSLESERKRPNYSCIKTDVATCKNQVSNRDQVEAFSY